MSQDQNLESTPKVEEQEIKTEEQDSKPEAKQNAAFAQMRVENTNLKKQLAEYQKQDKVKQEKEMTAQQKLDEREKELETLKKSYLQYKASFELKSLGFDGKLAKKLATDVKEESFDEDIKNIVKEWKEYLAPPTESKKEEEGKKFPVFPPFQPRPNNPQPKTNTMGPAEEIMNGSIQKKI